MLRSAIVVILATGLLACGASSDRLRPTRPRPAPQTRAQRQRGIDDLGRRAWDALAVGALGRLLYDDVDLHALVNASTATRLTTLRAGWPRRASVGANTASMLANAEYAGVCVQGARIESADDVLGLLADGWIFDRMLVIGRRPNGQRIAAWIEGTFLFTDAGWAALDIERVEEPRWEHSDLEIAPCDLAIRNDLPERAR